MSFQSWFATDGVVPDCAQPSRNFSLREAISEWIFLPIALRRSSASAGEKPAMILAISEVLLLVDADPVRGAGDLLQAPVDVRDALLAVLAFRVARDVAHRPRAVERDERDQILEDGRPHLPQRLAHARALELEDADRVAAREHLVRLLVVERDRAHVDAGERLRLVDHVQVPQAEEVHLQQAERLDVAHRELRHDLLVGAFLLERDDLDQRPRADHDAGGVDRVLARQPFERRARSTISRVIGSAS